MVLTYVDTHFQEPTLKVERILKGNLKGWWTVADVSGPGATLCHRWKMIKNVKYLVIPGDPHYCYATEG